MKCMMIIGEKNEEDSHSRWNHSYKDEESDDDDDLDLESVIQTNTASRPEMKRMKKKIQKMILMKHTKMKKVKMKKKVKMD